MAQEMNEQVIAAKAAQTATDARRTRRQNLVNFWCNETGREEVDKSTISTIYSYVEEFGEKVVYNWIEKAAAKGLIDKKMGMYISGIRRIVIAEGSNNE